MRASCLPIAAALLMLGCATAPVPQQRPTSFAGPLRATTLELPADEEMFPEGPAGDLLNANCLACHSVSMVTTQPVLSSKQWQANVEKMRSVFKAPIDPADDAELVKALVALNADAGTR